MAEQRATRRWLVADLLLLALALALAAMLAISWTGTRAQAEPGPESMRHLAVSQVARAQAEAFLAVDHRDMDTVVQRVLDGATGDFAEEYAAGEADLVASVTRSRTVAESSARALGVAELDEDRAVVLVAADSEIRTREGGQETELRKHRLRLEVVREGERWLVSELGFVR